MTRPSTLAAVLEGVLEGESDDPVGAVARDQHHRFGDGLRILVHADEVLDPGVEPLRVLTNDHQIQVRVARVGKDRLGGPHVGVEVEVLAERDVDRAKTGADGGREWAFEGYPVGLDRLQGRRGQRVQPVLGSADAGQLLVPLEGCPGGLQDSNRRGGNARPDSVSWYQGGGDRHPQSSLNRGAYSNSV